MKRARVLRCAHGWVHEVGARLGVGRVILDRSGAGGLPVSELGAQVRNQPLAQPEYGGGQHSLLQVDRQKELLAAVAVAKIEPAFRRALHNHAHEPCLAVKIVLGLL